MGFPSKILIGPSMTDLVKELRVIINKYFLIEDVRWDEQKIAFYVQPDDGTLDDNFNSLRKELIRAGFVPALVREQFDYIIYITKKPQIEPRSVNVNIVMFILTIISTVWAGAVQWAPRTDYEITTNSAGGYLSEMVAMLWNAELVGNGALYFALPLMLILGIHELGHYYMSKKHNVDASLPFFIPIPPFIGPLGTFGAFISMREPMPSKKALMDIGAAGPVAGFIVAIPVTIIGLYLTGANPIEPEMDGGIMTFIGQPLLFIGLESLIPIPHGASIHPTAFAGWVGLLVTAMNLLPAGQLDGGHIMRALFGNNSKYISYFVVMVLIVLGFLFAGWWIFTFLILMLGTNHPPPLNDISKLSRGRKAIGAFSIVMLVICFIPIPIQVAEIPEFEINTVDEEVIAGAGEDVNFTLMLGNMGSDKLTYEIEENVVYWKADMEYFNTSEMNGTHKDIEAQFSNSGWMITLERSEISIGSKKRVEYKIDVKVPDDALLGDELTFRVELTAKDNPYVEASIELSVVVGEISMRYSKISQELKPGTYYDFEVEVKNTGDRSMAVGLNASINKTLSRNHWSWSEPDYNSTPLVIDPKESQTILFTVKAPDSAQKGDMVVISFRAYDLLDPGIYDQTNFEVEVI